MTFLSTGFWGGLVPENAFNATALKRLLDAGALGLKVQMSTIFKISSYALPYIISLAYEGEVYLCL